MDDGKLGQHDNHQFLGFSNQQKLTGGQTRNSGHALPGTLLQQEAEQTTGSLAHSPRRGELVPQNMGEGRGEPRGGAGGVAQVVCPSLCGAKCRRAYTVPCFGVTHPVFLLQALQKWQLAGFFFFLCIFWSRICPNCTCTQLFLVPYNFFVSCSSRRGVSRCSTGSHVPAPSLSQTDWHREESGESSRLKNSAFKTRKLWNQGVIRRGFQVNEPIHSPRDGRGL